MFLAIPEAGLPINKGPPKKKVYLCVNWSFHYLLAHPTPPRRHTVFDLARKACLPQRIAGSGIDIL